MTASIENVSLEEVPTATPFLVIVQTYKPHDKPVVVKVAAESVHAKLVLSAVSVYANDTVGVVRNMLLIARVAVVQPLTTVIVI